MITEVKPNSVIKYWAPDGKKYQADSWEEANQHCEEMAAEMRLPKVVQSPREKELELKLEEIEARFETLQKALDKQAKATAAKTKKGGK